MQNPNYGGAEGFPENQELLPSQSRRCRKLSTKDILVFTGYVIAFAIVAVADVFY